MAKPKASPILGMWFGVVATGFAATFIMLSEAPPLVVATYRFFFASVGLLPFLLFTGTAELKKLTKRDLLFSAATGAAFGISMTAYIASLSLTTVASAGAIASLSPIYIAIGSAIFLKEKIAREAKIGIVLAVLGGLVVGGGDFLAAGSDIVGDLAALISGLLSSVYFVAGRGLRQRLELMPYLLVLYVGSFVTVLVVTLVSGSGEELFAVSPRSLMFLTLLGVVCTVFGYGAWNWALKYVPASSATVIVRVSPVLEAVLVFLFLGQVPGVPSIIGGVIVLIGAVIASRGEAAGDGATAEQAPAARARKAEVLPAARTAGTE